ncbi:MAG: 3-isopropylmalate dehydratase small subunit [Casimicrobiaceae bacterium]|nr:3-isopropylmalate dehydratase small subunit [Casimicrobiaceae bacterium]MDW8313211.1 3-isopropylmalate dehydratase small subunit [Burkholderiales bacterium]
MEAFIRHCGVVAPLDRANVDTDAIIPKQYLKSIRRTGYGDNCFDEWRYLDPGEPGSDPRARRLNPEFVLNQPRYAGASILLARRNFGCGSSREHAAWALLQYGFRAILAPSFGDIFHSNALNNGLLVVALPEAIVDQLFVECEATVGYRLTVDLAAQRIERDDGSLVTEFEFDPARKERLLKGLDDIGLTLQYADEIRAFEAKHFASRPWLLGAGEAKSA